MDPTIDQTTLVRIETVKKLKLDPGDILHVTLGGEITVGDKMVTWVPTHEDLLMVAELWDRVAPPDVAVLVTHHMVEEKIIQSKIRVNTWPPKGKRNVVTP